MCFTNAELRANEKTSGEEEEEEDLPRLAPLLVFSINVGSRVSLTSRTTSEKGTEKINARYSGCSRFRSSLVLPSPVL